MQSNADRATGKLSNGRAVEDNAGSRLFAVATLLARKGRYPEATKTLQDALDASECGEAEAYDLQARISVQQGLYLDAEFFWQKARRADRSNPLYQSALDRLRGAHESPGRAVPIIAATAVLALLGLLLWQTLSGRQVLRDHREAHAASTADLRGQVAAFRDAAATRDRHLTERVADLADNFRDLGTRLSEQIKALPTASRTTADRSAAMAHLGKQLAGLRETVTDGNASLAAGLAAGLADSRARADLSQSKRIQALQAAVTGLGKRVESIQGDLDKQVASVEAVLARRLEGTESALRRDLRSLSTSADLAATAKQIAGLQEQLASISAALGELKRSLADKLAPRRGIPSPPRPTTRPRAPSPRTGVKAKTSPRMPRQ